MISFLKPDEQHQHKSALWQRWNLWQRSSLWRRSERGLKGMFRIIRVLPKPIKGQTLYCNCQKDNCFPCQHTAVVLADTEDGSLQLCKSCQKVYEVKGSL